MKWWQVNAQLYSVRMEQRGSMQDMDPALHPAVGGGGGEQGRGECRRGDFPASPISNL